MESDDNTPRESGSLAVFEKTCEEAIEKLRGDDSERADELRSQARALLVELQTWSQTPPHPVRRGEVVSLVVDVHRAVSEYGARV